MVFLELCRLARLGVGQGSQHMGTIAFWHHCCPSVLAAVCGTLASVWKVSHLLSLSHYAFLFLNLSQTVMRKLFSQSIQALETR